jgi:hypothetical protein
MTMQILNLPKEIEIKQKLNVDVLPNYVHTHVLLLKILTWSSMEIMTTIKPCHFDFIFWVSIKEKVKYKQFC